MSNDFDDEHENQLDKALLEFMRRFDAGKAEDRESFYQEFPDLEPQLRKLLDAADWIESMAGPTLAESLNHASSILNNTDKAALPMEMPPADPNARTLVPLAIPFQNRNRFQPISINDSTLPPSGKPSDNSLNSPPSLDNSQSILPYRFGDYVLEQVLGRGGMGVVYLAYQVQLERRVALKMIRSGCFASGDEVNRFYTEARSAASLTHPNIVTVYHCGEIDGHHFFAMDFIPGTDLSKRLETGPMAPRVAVRYVRDVARAIDYAHDQGVVHRDLKPANVLIDETDAVVVTDFGLAKQMDSDQGLTATGAALGTPSYMSPEQAAGRSEEQGASTDVYAIGAILYALLTGKPPFQAESVLQTLMQVIHRTAPTVRQSHPDIHVDLDTIVTKCLEKSPSRRYPSAKELAEDLDRFYRGIPIKARPPSFPRRIKHWLTHVPLIAAITGVRNVEPTRSQRMAQNVMIIGLLTLVLLWLTSGSFIQYWRNNSMPRHITIASGTPGGMYYELAGRLADRFQDASGHDSRVIATNGSLDNLKQLEKSRAQVALMQESSVRADQVAVVAPLFYEAFHILVPGTSDTHHVSELQGKQIVMGAKESGTRQAATRVLKHFGVTSDNSTIVDGDWTQTAQFHQVDAVIAVVRMGQAGIVELLKEGRFRLLSIENAADLALSEPMFRSFVIPGEQYGTINSQPIPTLATTALLVVRKDASNRLVEECLKIVYEKSPASDGFIPLELAANWQGLPYHEAARKYFDLSEGSR